MATMLVVGRQRSVEDNTPLGWVVYTPPSRPPGYTSGQIALSGLFQTRLRLPQVVGDNQHLTTDYSTEETMVTGPRISGPLRTSG